MLVSRTLRRLAVALLPGLPTLLAVLSSCVLFLLFLKVKGTPAW